MRFAGHQTFSIRDGWLFKGLQLLVSDAERFDSPRLQDDLGVGKNMAKAIRHWLRATGLAVADGRGRKASVEPSALGQLVWKHDPYFLYPGTWWILHASLVLNPRLAYTWSWFFNRFSQARFDRPVVVEALRRQLLAEGDRMPAIRTLERDVACLLRSYAQPLPPEENDPEDNLECPMVDLGLLTYSRQSGSYTLIRGTKHIPFSVFGWLVSRTHGTSDEPETIDLSLTELAYEPESPGRVFALSAEALYEMMTRYRDEYPDRISLSSQAGERIVRLRSQASASWLEEYLTAIPSENELLAEVC